MLEPRTIPTATGAVSTAQPSTGRALGEAITALRRGEPALIRDYHVGALAVAAELATEENLHRLRKISQGPASMVLTRRRAVALGLTPREELCAAMTIPVSFQLPAVVIRNLADPAASVGTYLPGLVPEPVVAESAELAAIALAKLASLFPTRFRAARRSSPGRTLSASRRPRGDRGRSDPRASKPLTVAFSGPSLCPGMAKKVAEMQRFRLDLTRL